MFAASSVRPGTYLKYEFMNWRRALERGAGLCLQHSIAAAGILREQGIYAQVVDLSGHVVIEAIVGLDDGERWTLDPDFGVVVPLSIHEIESAPKIVRPYYLAEGHDTSRVDRLIHVFGSEGNGLFTGYTSAKILIEKVAYCIKWVLPFVLLLPFPAARFKSAARSGGGV